MIPDAAQTALGFLELIELMLDDDDGGGGGSDDKKRSLFTGLYC